MYTSVILKTTKIFNYISYDIKINLILQDMFKNIYFKYVLFGINNDYLQNTINKN